MTDNVHTEDGCVLCLVRQLTEGTPKAWWPENEGDTISGVVLRMGEMEEEPGGVPSHIAAMAGRPYTVPFVDLFLGGSGYERSRIKAYGTLLRQGLKAAEIQIGDRLTVRYDGDHVIQKGPYEGRTYRTYTVEVIRGHH